MTSRYLSVTFLLCLGISVGAQVQTRGGQTVRTIPLSRTVAIPLVRIDPAVTVPASQQAAAPLGVWPGAADEPPEGPTGFDVFDDGTLAITDPLLKRVSLYSAQGKFQNAWQLGFAADSIRIIGNQVLIREATTGESRRFDREGRLVPGTAQPIATPSAHMVPGGNRATVDSNPAINVNYGETGSSLLSVEALPTDNSTGVFIALEATAGGGEPGAVEVKKTVRRYTAEGSLAAETEPIPLNYYVLPVDELRTRKGVIYQLMTTNSEVRIHEWDTNAR